MYFYVCPSHFIQTISPCLVSVLFYNFVFVDHVGNVAGMAEDGSFIGKYSKDRNPEQSSAFATLV